MKITKIIYEQNGGEYYGVVYVNDDVEQVNKNSFVVANVLVELDENIDEIRTFYSQDDNEDAKGYAHFKELMEFKNKD